VLCEDQRGNQLLELIRCDEAALSSLSPLTHALVVARRHGSTLLVFNRYRQYWELAGGVIDAGETPRQCAARELQEESAIRCADDALRFVGAMKFLLQPSYGDPSVRLEYGALYAVGITSEAAFVPNEEIAAVSWWNGADDIGAIAEIDAKLSQLA
jgi:8-oxo-dGTP diphosphatase